MQGIRDIFSCGVAGCLNAFPPKTSTGLNDTPTQIALEGSTIFASQRTGAQRQGPMSTLVLTGIGLGSDVPTGIATTVGSSSASAISYKRYLVDSQGRSFAQPTRLRLPSLRTSTSSRTSRGLRGS